jgi:3D (Asp-Asp-Asp) domain-containing protein/uncharacterized coiled-coil protein SlyX
MGNKDNPRRHIREKVIAGSIGAFLLIGGGYVVLEQNSTISKQGDLISEYKQELVEQGSLIDQQNEELSTQKTELTNLNKQVKDLNTKLEDGKKKVKAYESKIDDLEEELSFKKAKAKEAAVAAAKRSSSEKEMPVVSRGTPSKGRTIMVEATGYIAMCSEGCSGITATGINLRNNPHAKVIAVDPNVIPLGSKVYVPGYGYAIAGDTGGGIDGHEIDIHMPTTQAAIDWGRRTIQIKVLD